MPDGLSIGQKLHENLKYLRSVGASREEIDAEIARAREATNRRNAEDKPDTGLSGSQIARIAGQGVTLNLGDEIEAGVRSFSPNVTYGDALSKIRGDIAEGRSKAPKTAFALEMAGGLVPGIGGAGLLAKGAKGAQLAGRMMSGAAASGAVAGAGAGENPMERVVGGAIGGTAGAVLGRGAQWIAGRKMAKELTSRGVNIKEAQAIASQLSDATPEAINKALARVDEFAKLGKGEFVTAADALGTEGGRALRAATNVSKKGDAIAGERMRVRDANIVSRSRGDVGTAAGFTPGQMDTAEQSLLAEQRAKASSSFGKAREEGAAFDEANPLKMAKRSGEGTQHSARHESGGLRGDLTKVTDEGIADEYARLVEHEAQVNGEQVGSYRHFGTYDGAGMAATKRTKNLDGQLKSIATARQRVEEELARRGMSQDDALWMANKDQFSFGDEAADAVSGAAEGATHPAHELTKVALDDEIVQRKLGQLISDNPERYREANPTEWAVMHKVYTRINKEIGKLKKNGNDVGDYYDGLLTAKAKIGESLAARSESFRGANAEFADLAKGIEAYNAGGKAASASLPSKSRALRAGIEDGKDELFRKGNVDRIAEMMGVGPNADLGAAATAKQAVGKQAVATQNAADKFRLVHGEDAYNKLLERAKAEGRFAATSRAVQGNSTTAKQAADIGLLPLVQDVAASAAINPAWWLTMFGRRIGNQVINKIMRNVASGEATAVADALTRGGAKSSRAVLEGVLAEMARKRAAEESSRLAGAMTTRGLLSAPRY